MRDPIICWVILLFYLGNSAVTFVSTETILGVEKKSFRPQNQNGSQNSEPKYDEPVHKTWEVKQQEILKRLYNFLKKLQELEKKNHSMVKRNTSEIHSGHIFDKIYDDFKKNQFLKKIDAIKSISKFDEEDRGKKLISTDDVVDILTRKIAEMATKNLNNTGETELQNSEKMQMEKSVEFNQVENTPFPQYFDQNSNSQTDENHNNNKNEFGENAVPNNFDTNEMDHSDFKLTEEIEKEIRKYLETHKDYGTDIQYEISSKGMELHPNLENLDKVAGDLGFNSENQIKSNDSLESINTEMPKEKEFPIKSSIEEFQSIVSEKPAETGSNGTETLNLFSFSTKQENLALIVCFVFICFCCIINAILCFYLHIRQHFH